MIQAIWSRTSQTKTCRCRSCFHAATTNVARRATTATGRRRLKASDLFTACYSTILATAAVADAKVKEDRMKEWDRVIAEAKESITWAPISMDANSRDGVNGTKASSSLRRPKMDTKVQGDAPAAVEIESEFVTWSPLRIREVDRPIPFNRTGYTYKEFTSIEVTREQRGPSANFGGETESSQDFDQMLKTLLDQDLNDTRGFKESAIETDDKTLDTMTNLENSDVSSELEWVDEEPDELLPEREPRSKAHLERRELSCTSLVEALLSRLMGSVQNRSESNAAQKLHPDLRDILIRIQHLQSGYKKLPNYKWADVSVINQERRALHQKLLQICDAVVLDDTPSLDFMLADICYTLLIAETPMSTVTYNILIQSLGRLKRHDLAQVVVDSFMHETILKPNRHTIRILLDHYYEKGDKEGWRSIKNRMNASVGDMRIKRRFHEDLDLISVQKWIYNTRPSDLAYKPSSQYLTQKPPLNAYIFDALIRGSLRFNGPRNAILHIKRAIRDSHKVYSDTICQVMTTLLRIRDVRGSTSLIDRILSLWREGGDPSTITFTTDVRALIYQLLHMIGVDTSLGSQIEPPNHLHLDEVQNLLRQMQVISLEDAIQRSEEFVEIIEDHLEDVYASRAKMPIDESVAQLEATSSTELRSLQWLSNTEYSRTYDLSKNMAIGRQHRLRYLESQLDFNMEKLGGLQTQALPFALHVLPRYQQLRYLSITSGESMNFNKGQTFTKYQQLLRVRQEGAMGLAKEIEKQLSLCRTRLERIEDEAYPIPSSSSATDDQLSTQDYVPQLAWASHKLMETRDKTADLASRISQLVEMKQNIISKEGARVKAISRGIWKLEQSAGRLINHQKQLLQMWSNVYANIRRQCCFDIHKMLKTHAQILANVEDHIYRISPNPLPWTLPRAIRHVHRSKLQIEEVALEINSLQGKVRHRKTYPVVVARGRVYESEKRMEHLQAEVDEITLMIQARLIDLPLNGLNLDDLPRSSTSGVEKKISTPFTRRLPESRQTSKLRSLSITHTVVPRLELDPVFDVEHKPVIVAAVG